MGSTFQLSDDAIRRLEEAKDMFLREFWGYACGLIPDPRARIERLSFEAAEYAKGKIARRIFFNYDHLGDRAKRKGDNWEYAGKLYEQELGSEFVLVRHLIYRTYLEWIAQNSRNPKAIYGGTYDCNFLAKLSVISGKDGLDEIVKRAWECESFEWLEELITKTCRRKLNEFLPKKLYSAKLGCIFK